MKVQNSAKTDPDQIISEIKKNKNIRIIKYFKKPLPVTKAGMEKMSDPDPAQLEKNPDPTPNPTLNRNEEKNIFIF